MRQLKEEGWIHHVAREAVGCFLTRGCLWINWEEGYKAFDELLLDSEWSVNASCWMWLSCSSYIKGSVPWYCPVDVAKKMDPSASYIK
jgi:cryptochrome